MLLFIEKDIFSVEEPNRQSRTVHTLLFFLSFLLLQNCFPKPSGTSFLDTFTFANFASIAQTPIPLKVRLSGLTGGTLVLANQDNETLSLSSNGDFNFPEFKPKYSSYSVSVKTQPTVTPAIDCVITNANGILSPFFEYVEVVCATRSYPLSVQVYGISSSVSGTLQIRSGNVDLLNLSADGTNTFAAPIPDQSSYTIQIVASPQNHICQFEIPANATGTMTGPNTVLINCLSVTNSSPPNQTVLKPSDNVDLTFSKNVSGCVLDPVNTPAGNLKSTHPGSNFSYPTSNTIRITSGGTWTTGVNQYLRLTGCIDPGSGKAYNNGTPLTFTYTVANEVKYASPGGAGAGLCDTVATACSSIRYAVAQCSAVPCFVLVSEGIFSISDNATQRIDLKDGVNLMGGFDSTFTQRNGTTHTTIIEDISPPGNCGASEGVTCAPIFAGPPFTTMTSNLVVNLFTIKSNPNNPWATGIFLNGLATGASQLIIAGNVIQGTDSSSAYTATTIRSGIATYNVTPNLNVSYNYIVGGSGNSISAGIYNNGSWGVIYSNWLNGNSHVNSTAADFSTALLVRNLSGAQPLIVSNNVVNSFQQIGTPAVTAASTSGLRFQNVTSTNVHLIHNTVFGGVGTSESIGIYSLGAAVETKIANNQVFTNTTATNRICISYTVVPGATAEVKGNNLFNCSILAQTPVFNFGLCAGNPGPLRNNLLCLTNLVTGANTQNFSHNPIFLPPTSALTYYLIGAGSKCDTVYGGVDPAYGGFITLYQNDFSGVARTTNSAPAPVPVGSFGYTIGIKEHNGTCSP